MPRLQRLLKGKVIVWAKTTGSDVDDVEHDTTGALTQNRTGQVCLPRTGPGPGAEIRQLRVQRRLINPQQHHVIGRLKRTTPLEEKLPACGIKTRQQRC